MSPSIADVMAQRQDERRAKREQAERNGIPTFEQAAGSPMAYARLRAATSRSGEEGRQARTLLAQVDKAYADLEAEHGGGDAA